MGGRGSWSAGSKGEVDVGDAKELAGSIGGGIIGPEETRLITSQNDTAPKQRGHPGHQVDRLITSQNDTAPKRYPYTPGGVLV